MNLDTTKDIAQFVTYLNGHLKRKFVSYVSARYGMSVEEARQAHPEQLESLEVMIDESLDLALLRTGFMEVFEALKQPNLKHNEPKQEESFLEGVEPYSAAPEVREACQ